MICTNSDLLDARKFTDVPTALFLIVPDEDTTRHIYASLIINRLLSDLIAFANGCPGQKLSRQVLVLWDEFGNTPPVKLIDTRFTAARSRGIRMVISVQNLAQLELLYGRQRAEAIRGGCQMLLVSAPAPGDQTTADSISKVLGQYTVESVSANRSERSSSTGKSLTGRALMTPDELRTMPFGEWVLLKSAMNPTRTTLVWQKAGRVFGDDTGCISMPVRTPQPVRWCTCVSLLARQARLQEPETLLPDFLDAADQPATPDEPEQTAQTAKIPVPDDQDEPVMGHLGSFS